MTATTSDDTAADDGSPSTSKKVLLAVAALGIIAALVLLPVGEYLEAAQDWVKGLGPWGPIAFIAIYIMCSVLFVPGSALTVGAGAIFGLWQGALIVSIGATLGATAAFLVGRYLARGWVEAKIEGNEKFAAVDDAVGREGFKIVLLTRLSPAFPFTLLNYAYGVTKVSLRDYFFASWIGMIPGTILYVYLGSLANAATEEVSTQQTVFRVVGLLATIAVTVYVTRIARAALNKETGVGEGAAE